MTQASDRPRHSQRVAIVLTVLVGVIATAVAYLGTRESTQAPVSPPAAPAGTTLPVETIVLPHDEPELPSGPHQRTFAASCTICHSTRLVMTQPPFPQKQWAGGGSQDGQDLRRPDHPGGRGADRGVSHDGPG